MIRTRIEITQNSKIMKNSYIILPVLTVLFLLTFAAYAGGGAPPTTPIDGGSAYC